jgi:Protein of Unknown function (DUF2784)
MDYHLLAEATMVVHFAVLVYIVTGGFLAWRWPHAIWPHLLLASWGFSTITVGLNCPLTYVENWGRQHAGEQGLQTGFIDHYIEGVVYPDRYTGLIQFLAGALVVISWVGAIVLYRRRRGRRRALAAPTSGPIHDEATRSVR